MSAILQGLVFFVFQYIYETNEFSQFQTMNSILVILC